MKIFISFDDGHISDLKAVKLLDKYGFKAVFYIPSCQTGRVIQMSLKEIKEGIVNKGHEIGGHTVNHPMDMKLLTEPQIKFELQNNRDMLQTVLKIPVAKFCYPRGRHDERVRQGVKDAGYLEARTTRVLQIRNFENDPFQIPTTIHMFARDEYEGNDWLDMAKTYFLKALECSRTDDTVFFNIWGHTQELDAYNEWDKFEEILKFMRTELDK